jgi:hypothetical protein
MHSATFIIQARYHLANQSQNRYVDKQNDSSVESDENMKIRGPACFVAYLETVQ